MVEHLPNAETEQEYRNNLAELDALLALESWSTPLSRSRPAPLPEEGPWWWRGDEDASASFIESMGITFE